MLFSFLCNKNHVLVNTLVLTKPVLHSKGIQKEKFTHCCIDFWHLHLFDSKTCLYYGILTRRTCMQLDFSMQTKLSEHVRNALLRVSALSIENKIVSLRAEPGKGSGNSRGRKCFINYYKRVGLAPERERSTDAIPRPGMICGLLVLDSVLIFLFSPRCSVFFLSLKIKI